PFCRLREFVSDVAYHPVGTPTVASVHALAMIVFLFTLSLPSSFPRSSPRGEPFPSGLRYQHPISNQQPNLKPTRPTAARAADISGFCLFPRSSRRNSLVSLH